LLLARITRGKVFSRKARRRTSKMPGLHKEAIGQLKHKTPRGKTVQFICKDHGIMPFD